MTDVEEVEAATAEASDPGRAFERCLQAFRSEPTEPCRHLVARDRVAAGTVIQREDPTHPEKLVSACYDAPPDLVHRAVAAARSAAIDWAELGAPKRAALLRPIVDRLAGDRRTAIAAQISAETGKSRTEAFIEVDELRILVEIYCRVAEEPGAFDDPLDARSDGLVSRSLLRPFGVFGVISPFNYPMVLGAAPAVAAMLAGNTVVVKPSHLGPRSMETFVEIVVELGLPTGVFNLVYGGDDPGRALVASDIDGVAFVGSAAAGHEIQRAMTVGAYARPVIAEMGGKNPVVVTDSADLDAAAKAIANSAFGLSGQRCSALSRVIATPGAYRPLIEKVAAAAEEVIIGDPAEPDVFAGPVIEEASVERFDAIVADARRDGNVYAGGERTEYLVRPTVVADLPHGHPLTRVEQFLPFLTIAQAADFDAAVAEANITEYGLTAGIFTGDTTEASRFLSLIQAGCVNVNNVNGATTGWWPGNQTFGGWKASGSTGKQAYGRWYVLQFAREQCRTVPVSLGL